MNVLFFLPPASRGIDTMAEVVLLGRKLLRGGNDIGKNTDLSILVSRDICPFKFSLATTGATTNRFEHDCSLLCCAASTFFPRTHGPRQIPDDQDGKSRGSLARLPPFFSSSACSLYCSFPFPIFLHFLPAFLNAVLFPTYAS